MTKYFTLILSTISLALSSVIIRFLGDINSFLLVFYRLLFSVIILIALCSLIENGKNKIDILKSLVFLTYKQKFLIVLSGIIFGFHLYFWVLAVNTTLIANASICYAINPVLILIFSFLFFEEKILFKEIIAIILSFLGVLAIAYKDFNFNFEHFKGDVFALVSAFLYVSYFLIIKKLRINLSTIFLMTFVYCVSFVFIGIILIFKQLNFFVVLDLQKIILLLMLAIFPTILGHVLISYLTKFIKASIISITMLLEHIFAGFFAFIIFNEYIKFNVFLGYFLIIISVILININFKKRGTS